MPNSSSEESELFKRLSWFIRLRWLAVVAVFVVILFTSQILTLKLPLLNLSLTSIFILSYNIVFCFYYRNLGRKRPHDNLRQAKCFANFQIILDLISLIVLLHFSGGVENPFAFYFIFHMIIASILLSRRASFLQASFAVILFCGMAALEYRGIIPHYCLTGFLGVDLHQSPQYLLGMLFVFTTTVYLSVYMASSISDKLRLRSRELSLANEKLLQQDRLKNEYVHRVTHNIKAHLAAIESCIAPVADEITGKINSGQRDLLERARSRTAKLLFFVQALLKLTQLKLARDWTVKEISLDRIIRHCLDTVEPKAKAKKIRLITEVPPGLVKIRANEMSIEEVLVDLITNSVKYSPAGGRVEVRVKDLESQVLVEIQDNGIGIAQEDLARLFTEFYRAANAQEIERDGTGLGLSISRHIIERHGGRIWAESEGIGKGSKFSFILPK
jgi:signal transduction histidine kinase